ncbi:hypothetical protein [Stappia sp. MMSF_3263]|uniref:hypothetical protein n=1 Tax=Stappia sp. MMSF_3263 TaxID=3046693 RepID=UPI00273F33F0|nr:hypothetical protein [Stappia sp. MMSF_3263]
MLSRFLAALAPLVVAACGTAPLPVLTYGPGPDNAQAAVLHSGETSVVSPYTHRLPVDPGNWRKLNDRQAPGGGAS